MFPMNSNYTFQYRFPIKQNVYPTAPYMTIRRDGIEVFRLPVSRRKLMDMIKKFDPNDISYIDEHSFYERLPQADATSIQDPANKYFVINGDTVWAKALQGSNGQLKAKFKITVHSRWDIAKPPITLQVQNQDLYLAYEPNADRQLKVLPLGQRILDFKNPDTRRFFFYLVPVANRRYSFRPVTDPDSLISTSPDSSSRVTAEPASGNSHHTVFAFDATFVIGVGNGSSFLRPDIENILISGDDASFHRYKDIIFQNRYQSIVGRENYAMGVTSLVLNNPYRWPRQDNYYQSNYLGRQYMCK